MSGSSAQRLTLERGFMFWPAPWKVIAADVPEHRRVKAGMGRGGVLPDDIARRGSASRAATVAAEAPSW